MPVGGARPGAGRPKGKKDRVLVAAPQLEKAVLDGMTPLEYLLSVMRDPQMDGFRRDRAAVAAAPYVHEKVADRAVSKKEDRVQRAHTGHVDTEWGEVVQH